jgi:hypothetical protein
MRYLVQAHSDCFVRNSRTSAQNSAGRVRWTEWPAPSDATSRPDGIRAMTSASLSCGILLVDPPPISSSGLWSFPSSAHQAGSGAFSCRMMGARTRPSNGTSSGTGSGSGQGDAC